MPRPKNPDAPTPTERVNRSVAALRARGGARKTWRISPEAHRALRSCQARSGETETALINRLLLEEAMR